MKKRDWQNTPFIAVTMMLVAVVATLLFTEAPEYVPDPAEPLWGEWVAVSIDGGFTPEWQHFFLSEQGTVLPSSGGQVAYTFDPQAKTLSVDGPESVSSFQFAKWGKYDALLSIDLHIFVRKADADAAKTDFLLTLEQNETIYADFLGEWIPVKESDNPDPLYSGKTLTLNRNLRAIFAGAEGSIPFTDNSPVTIFLYPPGNRKEGIRYRLTTQYGYTVLEGNGITYARKTDADGLSSIYALLSSMQGEWVCWDKGQPSKLTSSQLGDLGQRFELATEKICIGETGVRMPYDFDSDNGSITFQGNHFFWLRYSEEYGFPMLHGSDFDLIAYVRAQDLDQAHQVYLQKSQAYAAHLKAMYQQYLRDLKRNRTEAFLHTPLVADGAWALVVKKAVLQQHTPIYSFIAEMELTNLSDAPMQASAALQNSYFFLPLDWADESDYAAVGSFLPNSILDTNGKEPEEITVAPGETITLRWVTDTIFNFGGDSIFRITDPALQDYFIRFTFDGTEYYLQMEEDFEAQ